MTVCRKCEAIFEGRYCKSCNRARAVTWRNENKELSKANSAKWYANNKARARELTVKWAKENPDKIRSYTAKWNAENPDKVQARTKKYFFEHPDARRIYKHTRRARESGNGGKLSVGLTEKLFKLQKGKCPCCGNQLGDDYQLDHRMPLALGGQNSDDNTQLLRRRCNGQKSGRHPIEFMRSRGFLL